MVKKHRDQKITLFWFRRDLRLEDNAGLYQALKNSSNVQPVFIFDSSILQHLPADDRRVTFIHQIVQDLKITLQSLGSDLWVEHGTPLDVFEKIASTYKIQSIYANRDYEPYGVGRDQIIEKWASLKGIGFETFKDHVIFEKSEIKTDAGTPYTVFTPYKKKWLKTLKSFYYKAYPNTKYKSSYRQGPQGPMIELKDLGFNKQNCEFSEIQINPAVIKNYHRTRDYPDLEKGTTRLGLHLRFGTVSPRRWVALALKNSETWLSEIIWRDFFTQILWNFPHVKDANFRKAFDRVRYRFEPEEFKKWCEGQTGYPLVDAGMRQLNQTGYMHNRVRMVTAAFLTKHLLTHWSFGEKYFALHLLDYDLAANNGNWQWAAGTGCDAAPYFRIFNPEAQQKRFDPQFNYIKKWIPEFGTKKYPRPMVDHVFARERALTAFKKAFKDEGDE